MDGKGEVCLGLGLGLGLPDQFSPKRELVPQNNNNNNNSNNKRLLFLDLSIPNDPNSNSKMMRLDHDQKQASMSSFSNGSKDDDHDINFAVNFGRKKLRLTRDQTTLLEDSFRQHTTLNTVQKQALAEKLNLKPRQVEVWFQNRRARSKLKQTEVECEMLKKSCERLSDENRRLKKEVLELRSSLQIQKPAAAAFFHHNQKEAACGKNGTSRGGGEAAEGAAVVHEP